MSECITLIGETFASSKIREIFWINFREMEKATKFRE